MMRALWSAASGMIAQQTNVDTISHNLSNVNTVGYKTQKAEFKTLLYQDLQRGDETYPGSGWTWNQGCRYQYLFYRGGIGLQREQYGFCH